MCANIDIGPMVEHEQCHLYMDSRRWRQCRESGGGMSL